MKARVIFWLSIGFCALLVGCEKPANNETEQPEYRLDYNLQAYGGPLPSSWTCSYLNPTLTANLQAKIPGDMNGTHSIYLCLKKGTEIYCGNMVTYETDVGLPETYKTRNPTVEWGGYVPSGTYKLQGRILYNNDMCSGWQEWSGTLEYECNITACDVPEELIPVEYDHQASYDLFSISWLKDYIDRAFYPADTPFSFQDENEEINDKLLILNFDEVADYIMKHREVTSEMYVVGIQGFSDESGNPIENPAGYTIDGEYGYSLVAVQAIRDKYCDALDDEVIVKVTIHELGHHRGKLTHASGTPDPQGRPIVKDDHDSPYCVMNMGVEFQGDNDDNSNNDDNSPTREFISNPHFCPKCINKLWLVAW